MIWVLPLVSIVNFSNNIRLENISHHQHFLWQQIRGKILSLLLQLIVIVVKNVFFLIKYNIQITVI